jgi:hypothetical protein
LDPGTLVTGTYRLPEGHIAVRNTAVPLVNVQQGGDNVCGVAPPNQALTGRLLRGGAPEGSAQTVSEPNTMYAMHLKDSAGRSASTAISDTVEVVVGGETISVELPRVDLTVDWPTGAVQGSGPANQLVAAFIPATDCLGPARRDFTSAMVTRANQQGQFALQTGTLDPGTGFEVAFELASGHRVYRHVFRSLGQVFVHTSRVTGRANPSSPVTLVLEDAGGAQLAQVAGAADGDGWYDLSFPGAQIDPTNVVRLSASGEDPRIAVEDLTLDFSVQGGVSGTAPRDRNLELKLELADGRLLIVDLVSTGVGEYSFGTADIPPRADWDFGDVATARVTLPTANGHEIVAEVVLEVVPPTPQPGGGFKIYLPSTMSGS